MALAAVGETLKETPQFRVIFDEEANKQNWADFVELAMETLEHSYLTHNRVPTHIIPLGGALVPLFYYLEGVANKLQTAASPEVRETWQKIATELAACDENGLVNFRFSVKEDTQEIDGEMQDTYMFNRPIENTGSDPLVIDDIADTLKTFKTMRRYFGSNIQMVAPTYKEKALEQINVDGNIFVPESGMIPEHNGEDTWVFGGAGMNRTDQQIPGTSSMQRLCAVLYTSENCPLSHDVRYLSKAGMDPIVFRINKIMEDDLFTWKLVNQVDQGKAIGRHRELLDIAHEGIRQLVGRLLNPAA